MTEFELDAFRLIIASIRMLNRDLMAPRCHEISAHLDAAVAVLRRNEVTPGEPCEPEKDPSPPKLCPYHGSYHPCMWCEKGAPDFNDPHPGQPLGPDTTPNKEE